MVLPGRLSEAAAPLRHVDEPVAGRPDLLAAFFCEVTEVYRSAKV